MRRPEREAEPAVFGHIETKLEICGRACIVNKDRDYLIILHLSNIGRPRTELARLLPE